MIYVVVGGGDDDDVRGAVATLSRSARLGGNLIEIDVISDPSCEQPAVHTVANSFAIIVADVPDAVGPTSILISSTLPGPAPRPSSCMALIFAAWLDAGVTGFCASRPSVCHGVHGSVVPTRMFVRNERCYTSFDERRCHDCSAAGAADLSAWLR